MIRSFSLKSNSRKHFTLQLTPTITEEYTLDQNAIIDDLLPEIITKHPEIIPPPSATTHELHVTNFKSRKVNWGTSIKNLIKEQFTLTIDPPLALLNGGSASPKTTPRSGSVATNSSSNLNSPANSTTSLSKNEAGASSSSLAIGNSTDKLVEEITTTSPRIKGVGVGQHLMSGLNSGTTTTATATSSSDNNNGEPPKVSLHLLLNKLTGKNTADASSDSMHTMMRNASVIKVNQSSPILFGGLLENHFPAHSSIAMESIPPVLEKMLSYLKQERVQRTTGIFRLTGSTMEKERYIQLLNEAQGKNGDLTPVVFPNSIDPNIVCNLMLEYFKSLDRGLFEPFQKFVEISEQTSENERVNMIRREIEDMNPICKNVIRDLFYYFVQVLLYKEENRLSVKSLSVVFGPVFLRGKVKEDEEVAIQVTDANKKGTISATKLITTRQLSQKMVDFYCKTVGAIIDNYSSIFENEMEHKIHHKKKKDKSNNNMMGTKTLDAFIQKLQDHKQQQNPSSSSSNIALKRPGDSSNSIFSPREPKKPTTKNEEEWEGIQKSWMQFVESWKKKYQDEKIAHEQTVETIKSTKDEIEFERSQIKGQLANLKEQLDEKKKYIAQKRQEWELQREQIALNWENEKVELEKEKAKRTKEVEESRDQFKKTLEYYSITNFQIDVVMGDEDDDAVSRMAANSAPPGTRASTEENPETGDTPSSNRNTSRSVIGQKIAVDSRFKKKTDATSAPPRKGDDDSDDSDEEEAIKNKHKPSKSVLFNDLDDKTPQSSINKTAPSSSVFLPTNNKKKDSSSSDDDTGITKRCGACKKKITGEFMETSDSYFHKHCFTCSNCIKEINGPFANVSGKFWCATCIQNKNKHVKYQTKEDPEKKPKPAAASTDMECAACKEKIINKADMVKALSKTYHKQCFVCQKCGNEFENMKFYDLLGDPVCATCKRKSIKSKAVK
ncbi:rho GTPase activating protein [Naegleria gruberi]|uniref:Rho GTPase activating protein n=1 Tax=Naegleria gruberi TaxID=5762 RepID=D2VJ40_NAEGR|nr:rho GTPase activating protein [Naegleria gruberi]EFC43211.1 rho GTPase activating protein [Naegleria gruberi]|eukprot:XP_002675955.1 rho GTPase activating protein [Naegleria gruberi strain NEG-M]